MIQPSISAAIGIGQADKIDLDRVASNAKLSKQEKLMVAARQFEVMLARQILHDAYKPLLHDGVEKNGVSSEIYRDMIVTQLGDAIGKSGAFGIASALHGQLALKQSPKTTDMEK